MLMTPNRVEAQSITDKGRELLAHIRSAGSTGITRAQMAEKVGKTRLNKWDEAQLTLLESEGFVTVTTRPSARLIHISEFVYKATGKD